MRDKDVEAEGVRFQMMQREADANGLENAVAVLRANIQNNLENRDRIRRELEQQEGRADSIGAQIAERKERLEALIEPMSEECFEAQRSAERIQEHFKVQDFDAAGLTDLPCTVQCLGVCWITSSRRRRPAFPV